MTDETQPIETILERDIDLILLEELNANNYFIKWLINLLELPELTKNIGAWRSISDFGLGETDLLFAYNSNNEIYFVLLENKLDANFQEQQFERYQKRGEQYVAENKCSFFYSVLISPKLYAEGQNDFERFITYEDIRDYFDFANNERMKFKAKLINIAIEKSRRGYQPTNCEPVQKFWHSYWKFKEEHCANFKMNKPNIVPFGSDWIQLRLKELKGVIFYHKLSKGYIDATFCNFGIEIEYKIKNILPNEYLFVKHKSGRFTVRQKIDSIDRTLNFDDQLEVVKTGIEKIKAVSNWIIQNLK